MNRKNKRDEYKPEGITRKRAVYISIPRLGAPIEISIGDTQCMLDLVISLSDSWRALHDLSRMPIPNFYTTMDKYLGTPATHKEIQKREELYKELTQELCQDLYNQASILQDILTHQVLTKASHLVEKQKQPIIKNEE